ncbi:hypothetical protein O181_081655, partial [Austropuccinia psidii MF-1]|nr:hypothetical protein [Austropuccinia psidii MF-1]
LVLQFIMWLYLVCGLSRDNCRKARDMILNIIQLISQKAIKHNSLLSRVPCDIRTISKRLKLEFPLEEQVCCQKCYSLYDIEIAPEECTYQPTIASNKCYNDLFHPHKIHPFPQICFSSTTRNSKHRHVEGGQIRLAGQPRLRIPQARFISQSIHSWIDWFLNIPGIEAGIDQWKLQLASNTNVAVSDVAQGRIWKDLFSCSSNETLELGFGLFVDWFNPRGNRISGKQVSMGIIVLHCFNLQPRERFQPKYTCLAGLIPSPNQPDMVTISNVFKPLIDELLELNCGVKIVTPKYRNGRMVVVKLVGLIGDIVATHKVGGFVSHSAKHFCSWCELQDNQRADLKLGNPRQRRTVLNASHQWNGARTPRLRENFAKKNGIRWSELNRLPYWDPVANIALGVLHNWYEGVLQHHVRYRWGFDSAILQHKRSQSDLSGSESESESDEEMVDAFLSEDNEGFANQSYLSEEIIKKIRKRLREVVVPKGISHLPVGLCTARNGKLKANEWSVFFQVYLRLVILDIFWDLGPKDQLFLVNIGALIQCTEIVGARSVTQQDAQLFEQQYSVYQRTSNVLFPHIRITPNHHYAMHIPEQLLRWGPLNGISEYGGERLVGLLQKLKTNSLNSSSEKTIMKKFGQLQKLQQVEPELQKEFTNKCESSSTRKKALDDSSYLELLRHLQKEQPQLRDYRDLPHPPHSQVLTNFAIEHLHLSWRFGMKLSRHSPNNLIFVKKGKSDIQFAQIAHILDLVNNDVHKGPILMVCLFDPVQDYEVGFEGLDDFLVV